MASGLDHGSQFWSNKLLELNFNTNMSYTEALSNIADLETLVHVSKEEKNRLKIEVERKEAELQYKFDFRNTLRQLYEELKNSGKRADQLIKVKNYNVQLAQENYDLKKQKILEKDKQYKIVQMQLREAYEESMKIFESNPLVIKRNQLRNQVAKRKFEILYTKQKISDAEKVYSELRKMEKLVEQKAIIKFAEKMVNYYKKQRERNEMLNKQNLEHSNKMKEQKNNLHVIMEKSQENFVEPLRKLELSSFINPTNYDFLSKKTSQLQKSIETPKNMIEIQLPSLNMSNYQFNPKSYFNRNSSIISKPSEQLICKDQLRQTMPNIVNTPKLNLKSSIIPKFENIKEKCTTIKQKMSSQTKQKKDLKRPSEIQESVIKPKVSAKYNQDVKPALNTSIDIEERVFLSQPESKNSSQLQDSFVSLSQDSKKSMTLNFEKITPNKTSKLDNISMSQSSHYSLKPNQLFNLNSNIGKTNTIKSQNQPLSQRQSVNQIFNLQSPFSKNAESNDVQKQNQPENRQTSTIGQTNIPKKIRTNANQSSPGNQMFNLQATITKNSEINEDQKQISSEYNRQIPVMGQMFNMHTSVPERTGISEPHQQNPSEYYGQITASKNIKTNEEQKQKQIEQNKQTPLHNQMFNFKTTTPKKTEINEIQQSPAQNISKTVNNPISQPLDTKSPYFVNQAITSQEESVISFPSAERSDQINISSDQLPSQTSAEYFDENTNQPMDIEGMMKYYEENPNDIEMMPDLEENQNTSFSNFVSPAASISGDNQQVISAPINMFGGAQNTGNSDNSLFSFGQRPTNSGNFFNMF